MISLCSSKKKPLRPHPPSTYYRFVMKPYAKMWVWKHSFLPLVFRFSVKHFIETFGSLRLWAETFLRKKKKKKGSRCSLLLSFEGHSLHWTRSVEITEESKLIFKRNYSSCFQMTYQQIFNKKWQIVTIAHQLGFTAVVAILKKYSGSMKRDCTDSIFYIL